MENKIKTLYQYYWKKDQIMLAIAHEAGLPYERIHYYFCKRFKYTDPKKIELAIDRLIAKLTQKEPN